MLKKLNVFLKRKLRQNFKYIINKKDIDYLKNKNFVIISNNCWGASLFQWYKRGYNSPFVGLFLYGPCYLKLISNFNYYLNQELKFIENSEYPDREKAYPIGLIEDVEIHFTHYENETKAKENWERRTARMLKESHENYFFMICDRERVNKSHLIDFHQLPYKNKISFAVENYKELENKNHIKVFESYKNQGKCVPNGKKLFKLTFLYFDLNKWLLNE